MALALLLTVPPAAAQQTVFNVPSAAVLEPGSVYLESDWYSRPWATDSGRAALTSVRGVVGLGRNLEGGINVGPFDLLRRDAAFVDAAVKWAPTPYLYGGSHAGVGLSGESSEKGRSLTYGAFHRAVGPLRVGLGPYFATGRVFSASSRGGAQGTFEAKLPRVEGLTAAADWFSGRGGYTTTGLIYSRH